MISDNDSRRPGTGPVPPPAARRSVLDWPQSAGAGELVLREVEIHLSRRRRRRLALAAVGCAVLASALFWPSSTVAPSRETASAVISQPHRQTLPDGSQVEFNRDARIAVEFSADFRRVILLEGEAHFEVTKDPARPFFVRAGQVEVRAVGTAFTVQLGGAAVQVLVTEGRVSVDRTTKDNRPDTSPALVDAGHVALIQTPTADANPPALVEPVSATELSERLSWRKPRLEFSGTPLAKVIPLFGRYSGTRFHFAQPELGELEVSGIVRADNTEALLLLLKTNFGVVAEYRSAGEVVLSKPLRRGR